MDNVVANLLHFFTDGKKSFGAKTASAIVIVFALFFFDYMTGLSHHFQMTSKLSELEKISELKINYSGDSMKLNKLIYIEEEIINKEHYLNSISSLFSSGSSNPGTPEKTHQQRIAKSSILDIYWMIVSSSYGLLGMILVSLASPLFVKMQQVKNLLLGVFALIIVIGIGIAITTSIAYLIPVLDENKPYYNYILNVLIHGFSIWLLIVWSHRQNKKIKPV
ncbi:MAG: hypothetical protein ACKV1O_27560 [Saprospiraceae bacterium]